MNKIILTTTTLLAGAALALGGVSAADASTPTPAPSSSATSCSFGESLVSSWIHIPKAMRADLKKARAEKPGTQRRSDLKAIRTKALDGGYGAGVEAKAKFLQAHKGDGIRPLPDSLKADLKTLHGEKGKAAKVAEANTIADKALAGGYGAKVEALAQAAKASNAWQDCSPAVSGQGS